MPRCVPLGGNFTKVYHTREEADRPTPASAEDRQGIDGGLKTEGLRTLGRFASLLLERNFLNSPAHFAEEFFQAGEHFGRDARGVVGEVDQVALAALENLELKAIFAGL